MKTHRSTAVHVLTFAALLAGFTAAPAFAQQLTGWNRQVVARTNQNLESIDAVRKGFETFGRRWGDLPPQAEPVPAPTPIPQVPVIVGGRNAMEIRTGLVNLSKVVPAQVGLGETYECVLTAIAIEEAAFIDITDTVPDGASLVRTEPSAAREGLRETSTTSTTWRGCRRCCSISGTTATRCKSARRRLTLCA